MLPPVLYARTVLCDVYPLRLRGEKLSPERVRELGRRGHLELARRDDGAPELRAVLRGERGALAGELGCASVTKIGQDGLMVSGWEPYSRHRQSWWCVPVTGGTATADRMA